jgi:3-oxoacyl-[acyl-carrier-protein] synthase II
MMDQRIVITGLGIVCATGDNHESFVRNLLNGQGGIAQHSELIPGRTVWAGLVAGPEPAPHLDTLDTVTLAGLDRTARLAATAMAEALADSGLMPGKQKRAATDRWALIFGTSHGGRSQLDRFVESGADTGDPENAHRLLESGSHQHQTAALAACFGVHGPVITLSTACSSSGIAIAYGCELLRSDKVDMVVAGGADAFSKLTHAGFESLGAVADQPCGPFSDTIGITLGEGAGFLVLERLEQAETRQARIYAELFSHGITWDAHHLTAPEPSGEGMRRAMARALAKAGATIGQVDYINAHGTGTRANDVAESLAVKRLFETETPPPVSATKSFTGHALGASSVIGCLASMAASEHDRLPPTLNFASSRPGCDLDYVPNRPRAAKVDRFLADSAAFGGVNCVLYGGRYQPRATLTPAPVVRPEPVAITGVGVVSPLGHDLGEFVEGLRRGYSGICAIGRFDTEHLNASHAGLVTDFNTRRLMPSVNLRRIDLVTQYATVAASLALGDAGLGIWAQQPERVGLVVGATRGAAGSFEKYLASVEGGRWEHASAVYFPNLVMSSIGGNISNILRLKGLASTCLSGIGAGLHALINGFEFLRRDPDCDAVVVVAADEINPLYFRLFDRLGRLAAKAETPHLYDPAGGGLVLGEGAVALVLQRAARVREGATPYAVIAGYGLSNDARPDLGLEASGHWLERAARTALDEACIDSSALDLVYGLGRGQADYDAREARVLARLLADHRPALSCVNGQLGLAEASSALFAVAAALLGLKHGEAYPLLAAGEPRPDLPWVRDRVRRGDYRRALVLGGSEHGNNAALVLRHPDAGAP